ncbi:MAG: hypothetical protein HYU51_06495 [Candidatus Rokubacteria bacterium]|nr:hypothetical protein [Candidatus Rokubacteria bacterium]
MRMPEQVQRLAIVIGVIAAVVLVGRFVLMPPTLVARELHRSSTEQREAAKPVKFAGSSACQDCHDNVVEKKAKGYHKGLACEGCHGPAVKHTEDPSAVTPAAPRDRKFCPVCHAYDAARPTGFPQINPTAHNPLTPCIGCHDAHDPVPPRTPKACAACHAQIERTKAISTHALLACTTCHTVPEAHKKSPRTVRPSKPQTREFCGTCHAKDAGAKEAAAKGTTATDAAAKRAKTARQAPRVDLSTHGETFQCWQCHYPHLPEGRS